jgi:hypothetical protein
MSSVAGFPTSIWDGDSSNRDSDNAPQMAPDWQDWDRMIAEVAAVQKSNSGYDPSAVLSYGAAPVVSGLSVAERGNAAMHKSIVTLASLAFATTDGTTPATDGAWGSQLLYTFPQGHIMILGAHLLIPVAGMVAVTGGGTGLSDTADFEIGIGTTAANNQSAFGLAGVATDENVITGQVAALVAGSNTPLTAAANSTPATYDGSTTAAKLYLNMRTVDDADHGTTADVLTMGATLNILWTNLGDD